MHKILDLLERIDIDNCKNKINNFESNSNKDFSNKKLFKEYQKNLKINDLYLTSKKLISDLNDTIKITDADLKTLAQEEIKEINLKLDNIYSELEELLFEPLKNDEKPVIFEIRPGVGGIEAALFAEELTNMYLKYCSNNKISTKVLSISYNLEGGINESTFIIEPENSFAFFRFEAGVHRVQRIPKTESMGRVHTSTVSIVTMPEVGLQEVNINPNDLKIDVYRSSGPGGQSVNTTDSAVRITHIPTKITVTCQNEKSQHKNKDTALKILASRLKEIEDEKQSSQLKQIRSESIMGGKRSSKIRTYNFPQGRITDHRINKSWYNIQQAIFEGDIEDIIKTSNRIIRKGEATFEEESLD